MTITVKMPMSLIMVRSSIIFGYESNKKNKQKIQLFVKISGDRIMMK